MFGKKAFMPIILALIVCFCAFFIVKMQIETNRLENEKYELERENEEIRDEIDLLNKTLDEPKDEEYYESKAREKLNLRLPEEVIFYNDLIN